MLLLLSITHGGADVAGWGSSYRCLSHVRLQQLAASTPARDAPLAASLFLRGCWPFVIPSGFLPWHGHHPPSIPLVAVCPWPCFWPCDPKFGLLSYVLVTDQIFIFIVSAVGYGIYLFVTYPVIIFSLWSHICVNVYYIICPRWLPAQAVSLQQGLFVSMFLSTLQLPFSYFLSVLSLCLSPVAACPGVQIDVGVDVCDHLTRRILAVSRDTSLDTTYCTIVPVRHCFCYCLRVCRFPVSRFVVCCCFCVCPRTCIGRGLPFPMSRLCTCHLVSVFVSVSSLPCLYTCHGPSVCSLSRHLTFSNINLAAATPPFHGGSLGQRKTRKHACNINIISPTRSHTSVSFTATKIDNIFVSSIIPLRGQLVTPPFSWLVHTDLSSSYKALLDNVTPRSGAVPYFSGGYLVAVSFDDTIISLASLSTSQIVTLVRSLLPPPQPSLLKWSCPFHFIGQ